MTNNTRTPIFTLCLLLVFLFETYSEVENTVYTHNSIAIVTVSSFLTHPINDAMR